MNGTAGLFFCKITNDVLAGHDADECPQIVHHRDKVLVHGTLEKIIHGNGDTYRGVCILPEEVLDVELLRILHGADGSVGGVGVQQPPEKVSLADRTDVLAAAGDHGNGGVTVSVHFFKTLADGVIVI